jgi:hypothetical protein
MNDYFKSKDFIDLAREDYYRGSSTDQTLKRVWVLFYRSGLGDNWEETEPQARAAVEAEYRRLRRAQQQQQRQIRAELAAGKEPSGIPTTEVIDLPVAIDRFALIEVGRRVYDLDRPEMEPMALPDFEATWAGSQSVQPGPDGKPRKIPVTRAWLQHPNRKTLPTITYRAGAGQITYDPRGASAANLWRRPKRICPPENWPERAQPFVEHCNWLFGSLTQRFLDWLAHIEQRPGELPHTCFLHIARQHGLGRNWLASVLAEVFKGHVALGFDLVRAMQSGFNSELSRRHLIVVDEIHQGGNFQWRYSSDFRQLLTAEHRLINPKFGHQRVEYNHARWLIFSNEQAALPLDERDRRVIVVACDEPPRPRDYYANLYALTKDQEFVASVAEFLTSRDLSNFNPGERAHLTAAKLAMVDASRSEADRLAIAVAQSWPVDAITWSDFIAELDGEGHRAHNTRAIHHALDRAGIQRWQRSSGKLRLPSAGRAEVIYIVRNHAQWMAADAAAIRYELERVDHDSKLAALHGQETPPPCSRSRRFPASKGIVELSKPFSPP